MTQVVFVRWCLDANGRTAISVNPDQVDCTEHFNDAFCTPYGEEFTAATKIIMKGKQEYIVQGSLIDVVHMLKR